MTAISGRTAEVIVEYDLRKGGKIERRQKHFADAHKAKTFFGWKDEAGKQPKVLATEQKKSEVTPPKEAKPRSLAEAFPLETSTKDHPPTLIPVGDPSITIFDDQEIQMKTETTLAAEAKKKIKQIKADKKLRKLQKTGAFAWLTPKIRTAVKVESKVPQGQFHEIWYVKFDDDTEQTYHSLTVKHSRDHAEHHLEALEVGVGRVSFKDGLTNKQYEIVLRKCYEHVAKQARQYGQAVGNFMASKEVQKEMSKTATIKSMKSEVLTPLQIEMAAKIAELSNFYCCSPAMFFVAEDKKREHAAGFGFSSEKLTLANHGLDESKASISVMQYARRLMSKMTARLTVGGPQIATPELAREHDKLKRDQIANIKANEKQALKDARANEPMSESNIKIVKPRTPRPEGKDAFGNQLGTQASQINLAVMAAKSPITAANICAATNLPKPRVVNHLQYLCKRNHLVKIDGGYKLHGAASVTAKPPGKVKVAASQPKAAQPKAAGKTTKTAAAKAKGKGKPAHKNKR